MLDGPAKALAENKDVKEFYLGMSSEGRKSFRDMKSYRRRKRWVCGGCRGVQTYVGAR
jgi:branched-chain amino acid transport system ATP-binding protein